MQEGKGTLKEKWAEHEGMANERTNIWMNEWKKKEESSLNVGYLITRTYTVKNQLIPIIMRK